MPPLAVLLASLALLAAWPWTAQSGPVPDTEAPPEVAVIVDTSISMRERGMDPERSSLLVAKLLADIVPGELAVIRLLDLEADSARLPRRETAVSQACSEDPSARCGMVEPTSDWAQDARRGRFGLLARPARGEADYKRQLETQLAQTSHNSLFFLAFRAAQGHFESRVGGARPGANRTIVWLSDGRDENVEQLRPAVAELRAAGVDIRAVIFGHGDRRIPEQLGLPVDQARSPAELMRTFAQIFRRLVHAPYRVDGLVARAAELTVRPNVEELWAVFYGDDTLEEVTLSGPGGEVRADYAADRWPGAGAYRVVHLTDPAPGAWRIQARGGGPGLAYALIQRSALTPALLEPETAPAEAPVRLVAGIRAGRAGEPIADPQALEGARLVARIEDRTLELRDDGRDADARAGDGRFCAWYRFERTGTVPVELHLTAPVADRHARAEVKVSGVLRYQGPPVALDLGPIRAPGRVCRPVALEPRALVHQGEVALRAQALRDLPRGHTLSLRVGERDLSPGDGTQPWRPGEPLTLCLELSRAAPDFRALGEPWLRLAAGEGADREIVLQLRWESIGLGFWARWGWLILTLLALAAALLIALGFILPQRFAPTLAIGFAPDREDLDTYQPQSLRAWRGVGIGFYRDARAYLHPDYRLSGRAQGALAGLFAERLGTRVAPQRGLTLAREDFAGVFAPVPETGEPARLGEVYRIGDAGPFFRLSVRR